jgi:hypothetical protein
MKSAKQIVEEIVRDLNIELKEAGDSVVLEFADLKADAKYEGEIHTRIKGARLQITYNTPALDTQAAKANIKLGYFPITFVDYIWENDIAKRLDTDYWEERLFNELLIKLIAERIMLGKQQRVSMIMQITQRRMKEEQQKQLEEQKKAQEQKLVSSPTGEIKEATEGGIIEEPKIISMNKKHIE